MAETALAFGDWDTESLRVTIFHPGSESPQPSLWQEATGHEPDAIDSRPKEEVVTVTGEVGGNTLILAIRHERIDWLLQPMPTLPGGPSVTLRTLSQTELAEDLLRKATRLSVKSLAPIPRLAFGTSLIKLAESHESAMRDIAHFLPRLDLVSSEGTDLVFQINRRRRLVSLHIQVNRLAKWSIVQIGELQVRLDLGQSPSINPRLSPSGTAYARKLDLDINTVPGPAMGKDRVLGILNELFGMASEIAIEGDIP